MCRKIFGFVFTWLVIHLSGLMVLQAGSSVTFESSGLVGDSFYVDEDERITRTDPSFLIEVGAESFLYSGQRSSEVTGGLAAIMIDLDGRLSDRFSFFGAFHFDTSPWHAFLNQPMHERKDASFAYDIDLEVEEFFLTWLVVPGRLALSMGRRFSRVSHVNQLHLADFQFNTKPRVYTEYWGNNHGLALDGIGLTWLHETDRFAGSLTLEAAKNGHLSEQTTATAILDAQYDLGPMVLGIRGFSYFDYETEDHPLFHHFQDDDLLLNDTRIGMNAAGGSLFMSMPLINNRSLLFQSKVLNRKMAGHNFLGMYGFLILSFSESIAGSIMFQQLELPAFHDSIQGHYHERGITLGLSYFPVPEHRIRLEFSKFENSSFYTDMLLLKWTFYVSIMD